MKEFIICFTENKWYSLNMSNNELTEDLDLLAENIYYTFQVSDLIRAIKSKKIKIIPNIVDIESFAKQFSQKGKDLLDYKKWHILKGLRREEIIDLKYKVTDLADFLIKIKEFICKLKENSGEEVERFNNIEQKINEIIHKTTFNGIKIDREILNRNCIVLHKAIYTQKNEFQFSFNIFQPESVETQALYLKSKKYKILISIENTVSLLRKSDVVCERFYELNRLIKDLRTLMILKSRLGGSDFVNPYFVGFGSITSRIIIKEPSLQNLRKENRNIIVPAKDKELFYVDYSQFEASILAHCSGDIELLKLINTDDVYSDMVVKIYNKEINESSRKEAKILFYRYLYGDTFENDVKFKKIVEKYFNKFTTLSEFKNELITKSQKDLKVEPGNGNNRRLDTENENIWILSHLIQSKASYIFKRAIIETYEKVKNARLLIPLHDGALYEIDNIESEKIRKKIKNIFTETFRNQCGLLTNIRAEESIF